MVTLSYYKDNLFREALGHYSKYLLSHHITPVYTMQCKGFTGCQVETNHWALRCLWQRLITQVSWLLGLGRAAQEASGSTRESLLTHATALFITPFPHLREHWGRNSVVTSDNDLQWSLNCRISRAFSDCLFTFCWSVDAASHKTIVFCYRCDYIIIFNLKFWTPPTHTLFKWGENCTLKLNWTYKWSAKCIVQKCTVYHCIELKFWVQLLCSVSN